MKQIWTPHPYQRKALKFVLERPAAGLFLDPGLGKTSIMLAGLKVMQQKALVIAPLRVCMEVWPREVEKWGAFSKTKVVVLHGPKKEQRLEEDADIYCINPEGLPWLVPQWGKLEDTPKVLIIDEATKFKCTRTQRFKLLKQILPTFHRRYILTGTPIPNGLIDLFGQIYVLDLGQALGQYITHYRNQFFVQSGFGGYDWTILPGAEERIYERVKPLALRMSAEDYLDLPPVLTSSVEGVLPEKVQQKYTQLEIDYILDLGNRAVTALNAGALSIKLRQLTGGYVYDEERKTAHIHDAKAEQLEDLIEELSGQPTLVAYQFQHEGEALSQRLSAPRLGGGVSPKRTRELLEGWNRGDLPVLLIHPAAAAHGLNLQSGGRHLIWYSLPWDQEHYDQLLRRLWRQGQTKPVQQYHLIMRGTIDEVVLKALHGKKVVQDAFLDAMRKKVSRWRRTNLKLRRKNLARPAEP